ncbi:Scr1 family TA system antitoxin-like transcriptional regulator [Fodinicola acaciae]|uniref:Scr1 family TA system antitoxin-like transcriptional regulator n=1 Tax=Fodinicola acaciae TaxID=2681555 RepID=UPI0013D050C1|nr:Scr1 family TA system antitoxin-like transcriptional regulator [Fodinicola acaciae]
MVTAPGPIVRRQKLGNALREFRERRGFSLERVAEELMISTSKLSRLENAQGSPQARDVRDLLRFYEVTKPDAGRLMRWTYAARQQDWWTDYDYDSTGFTSGLDAHIAYESELRVAHESNADVARVYAASFVPGLLQTEAYARALHRSVEPWRGSEGVERVVRSLLRRQEVLKERDPEPLHLTAVMHETAVHQLVGSPEIMREQFEHLIRQNENANVELRILPFNALPVFTITCAWTHFEFGDSLDRDVVLIETHAGVRHIESSGQVRQYQRHFSELWRRALGQQDTRGMLDSAAGRW